jgi:hypothetical protein
LTLLLLPHLVKTWMILKLRASSMRDLQSLSSVMNQSRTVIAFYIVKIMIRNRIVYVTARSVSAWS